MNSTSLNHRRITSRLAIRLFAILTLAWPILTTAQDYLRTFPLKHESRYFDFRFHRNPERIAAIGRFADAFVGIVDRDFFSSKFDYPIRVLVLEDRNAFQAFLRDRFLIPDPPNFGIYINQFKLFATFEDSGLGTFTHEILHPLVEANLRDRPIWAVEAIPAFFEKFYGYWQDDGVVVHWGFQNPWRLQVLGSDLGRLDLKEILATTQPRTRYQNSDLRMVSIFLWEQGRFQRFLRLIERQEKNGYPSYFEAAMEQPLEKILPLWQRYLADTTSRVPELLRLPGSTIYENEAAFRAFAEAYGLKIPAAR